MLKWPSKEVKRLLKSFSSSQSSLEFIGFHSMWFPLVSLFTRKWYGILDVFFWVYNTVINLHNLREHDTCNCIVIIILLTVADIGYINDIEFGIDPHTENLLYFAVHSFAMLSTITNPILYGWLNTNLKHLFRAMIPTVRNERNHQAEPEYETYTPFQNIRYVLNKPSSCTRNILILDTLFHLYFR